MHGFLFFRAAECLSRTAHVCGYRAASFADQKEKNDLDASERLESGKLAQPVCVGECDFNVKYKAAGIAILSTLCKALRILAVLLPRFKRATF